MAKKRETEPALAGAGGNKAAKPAESIYSASEFAANAENVFGKDVKSECVVAAFRSTGKDKATREEAVKIVNDFLKKEVK